MMRARLPDTLPDRLPSVTLAARWRTEAGDQGFSLTAGFDPRTGALADLRYAGGQKTGSALQHSLQDACAILSVALRQGVCLDDLARPIARVPVRGVLEAASPIGAVLEALADAASWEGGKT